MPTCTPVTTCSSTDALRAFCRDADLELDEVLALSVEEFREISRANLRYGPVQHSRVVQQWRQARRRSPAASRDGGSSAASGVARGAEATDDRAEDTSGRAAAAATATSRQTDTAAAAAAVKSEETASEETSPVAAAAGSPATAAPASSPKRLAGQEMRLLVDQLTPPDVDLDEPRGRRRTRRVPELFDPGDGRARERPGGGSSRQAGQRGQEADAAADAAATTAAATTTITADSANAATDAGARAGTKPDGPSADAGSVIDLAAVDSDGTQESIPNAGSAPSSSLSSSPVEKAPTIQPSRENEGQDLLAASASSSSSSSPVAPAARAGAGSTRREPEETAPNAGSTALLSPPPPIPAAAAGGREDGPFVVPKAPPRMGASGLYARPSGRAPAGSEWDAVRGVWASAAKKAPARALPRRQARAESSSSAAVAAAAAAEAAAAAAAAEITPKPAIPERKRKKDKRGLGASSSSPGDRNVRRRLTSTGKPIKCCKIPDCKKFVQPNKDGMCSRHYSEHKRGSSGGGGGGSSSSSGAARKDPKESTPSHVLMSAKITAAPVSSGPSAITAATVSSGPSAITAATVSSGPSAITKPKKKKALTKKSSPPASQAKTPGTVPRESARVSEAADFEAFCKTLKKGDNVIVKIVSKIDRRNHPNDEYFVARLLERPRKLTHAGTYDGNRFDEGWYVVRLRWYETDNVDGDGNRWYKYTDNEQVFQCNTMLRDANRDVVKLRYDRHSQLHKLDRDVDKYIMNCISR